MNQHKSMFCFIYILRSFLLFKFIYVVCIRLNLNCSIKTYYENFPCLSELYNSNVIEIYFIFLMRGKKHDYFTISCISFKYISTSVKKQFYTLYINIFFLLETTKLIPLTF